MLFTNISAFPYLLLGFVVLTSLAVYTYFRKIKLLKMVLSPSLYQKVQNILIPAVRPLKLIFLLTAVFLLMLSLLDPRARSLNTDMRLEGIDVILVYDVSRSMDVQDVAPSRLEAAKNAGEKLADSLAGNRVGLVAFAADAYRLLPLTTDLDAVSIFIQDLNSDIVSSQSTDIGKALDAAVESFAEDTLTHKAVVLFTDGENLEGEAASAVDRLKKKGVTLFVVGTGTARGGTVPVYRNGQEVGIFRDIVGTAVISKLDQAAMETIVKNADGIYYSIEQADRVAEKIDLLQKSSFGTKAQSYLEPRFRIFAFWALMALLFLLYFPERRRFSLLILISLSSAAFGITPDRKGYESYKKKQFPSALRYYQEDLVKSPKNNKSKFGESASLYKMEKADRAELGFLALTNDSSKKTGLYALYNAGNAMVQGKKWGEALSAYAEILKKENPESSIYKKAMNNYLYVLQQKKNDQEQPQDKDQDEKNKDQDKNQDNQKQKDKEQDSQDQKNQENDKKEEQNQGQPQSEKDQTQSRPISPKEVDNLLGIAQAEEKQNLKRQNAQKAKGLFYQDKY